MAIYLAERNTLLLLKSKMPSGAGVITEDIHFVYGNLYMGSISNTEKIIIHISPKQQNSKKSSYAKAPS